MRRRIGGHLVDLETGEVAGRGTLRPRELALLQYLLRHPGRVVGGDELLREVWGYRAGVRTRTLYSTIYRLRAVLERDPEVPRVVLAVRGEGYRLVASEEPLAPIALPSEALVGREGELARLEAELGPGALVALVGAPGIGKTALARATAARRSLERRAVWVDGGGSLRAGLGTALGVHRTGDDDHELEAIGERLAEDDGALVVIDRADRLSERDRADLRALRGALDRLAVLVTGHSPTGEPGERVFELGPLDPDASVRLLARLRAGDPADPQLRALALRLEGLPLAIALAASLVRLVGVGGTVAGLLDSFAALDLAAEPGRSGLWIAIGESWSALGPDDQAALAALTVFRGGWTLAAATGLAGPDALRRLVSLRRRSLVNHDPDTGRFGLFTPISQFVRERTDPEGWRILQEQHADWFLGWCRARCPDGHVSPEVARAVAADHHNVLAAAEALATLGRRSEAREIYDLLAEVGHFGPAVEVTYAERALALCDDERDRARHELALARLVEGEGRPAEALTLALSARQRLADAPLVDQARATVRVIAARCLLDPGSAASEAEGLDRIAGRLPLSDEIDARLSVALAYVISEPERALRLLEAHAPLLREHGRERQRGLAAALRLVALEQIDPQLPEAELLAYRESALEMGHRRAADRVCVPLARVALRQGRAASALAHLRQRSPFAPRAPVVELEAWAAWLGGQAERCERILLDGLPAVEADPHMRARLCQALAQLERRKGRLWEARAWFEQGELAQPAANTAWQAVLDVELGDLDAARGRLAELGDSAPAAYARRALAARRGEPLPPIPDPPLHPSLADVIGIAIEAAAKPV